MVYKALKETKVMMEFQVKLDRRDRKALKEILDLVENKGTWAHKVHKVYKVSVG
jgi:hypothetical protein